MDTESFLLRRSRLTESLQQRRRLDLASFQRGGSWWLRIPSLLRMVVSLIPAEGLLNTSMQVGLPLLAALFVKKETPFLGKLLSFFRPSRL